ncbi:hypothetical protein FHX16_003969 [Rhizobium sp. BK661]|nr:hypothetical protein [Rhizobium sp. BK661]
MTHLYQLFTAFSFLLLAAISSSCTSGGPGARSLNAPLNMACAHGFGSPDDGSCSY